MIIRKTSQPFAKLRRAFFWIATVLLSAVFMATSATAQSRPSVPDENTISRLVWSTMIAMDNANRTDNYSVIYSLGSPRFQARNTPQRLAASFKPLRDNRVDIGRAIMIAPTFYQPPSVDEYGRLRLRGGFDYRPKSVRFDLMYELVNGGWQINAISVVEMDYNAPR